MNAARRQERARGRDGEREREESRDRHDWCGLFLAPYGMGKIWIVIYSGLRSDCPGENLPQNGGGKGI